MHGNPTPRLWMPAPRLGAVAAWALLQVACSGVPPAPEDAAAVELPVRELTEEQRRDVEAAAATGRARLEQGRPDQAVTAASRALEQDPRHARARAVLAAGLAAQAAVTQPPDVLLLQRAEGAFRLAQRLAPEDPVVAARYARFLVADGHLSAAVEVLDAALGHSPDDRELLLLAAESRYELGEERLALPLLIRLRAVAPNHAPSRYRLALCELRLAEADDADGSPTEGLRRAVQGFDEYRAMAPGDQDGWLAAGQARVRLAAAVDTPERRTQLLNEALSVWVEGEARFGAQPEFPYRVGWCFETLGRSTPAAAAYGRALQVEPDHAPSLLALAALRVEVDPQATRSLLLRALQADITADERSQVLRWLDQRGGPIPLEGDPGTSPGNGR